MFGEQNWGYATSLGKAKREKGKIKKKYVTIKESGAVSTQVCPNGGTKGPERMMGEFFGPALLW